MSIVSIRSALYSVIDGIKASAGISVVTDYEPSVVNDTPHVAVILDDSADEYATSNSTKLTVNFIVRVMVEHGKDVPLDTQTDLVLGIVDSILDALRSDGNQTLSANSCKLVASSISPVLSGEKGNTNILYSEISVETFTFKSVS